MRLPKRPELRNLPKSPRFTSVQWRNQTPGSLDPFFGQTAHGHNQVLDPSHPAAGVAKFKFPVVRRDDIGLKMLPMGLLLRELRQFPAIPILTWTERVQKANEAGLTGNPNSNVPNLPRNSSFARHEQLYPHQDYNSLLVPPRRITPRGLFLDLALKKAANRVPMSFHISTSKKRMGSFRYMRRAIETRLRAAISLIVTKGAYSQPGDERIQFNLNDAGRKWVLQGWAYMFFPTIEVYNMPYPKLINILRSILQNVNKHAIGLENSWLNQALLKQHQNRDGETQEETDVETNTTDRKAISINRRPLQLLAGQHVNGSIPSTSFTQKESNLSNAANAPIQKEMQERPVQLASTSKPPKMAKFPSKALAGKEPEVWKKELLAGLELIGKRLPPNLSRLAVKGKKLAGTSRSGSPTSVGTSDKSPSTKTSPLIASESYH